VFVVADCSTPALSKNVALLARVNVMMSENVLLTIAMMFLRS
jgi:hypothetical protein